MRVAVAAMLLAVLLAWCGTSYWALTRPQVCTGTYSDHGRVLTINHCRTEW